MNIYKDIMPRELIIALKEELQPQDYVTLVAIQGALKDAARKEAQKAWDMYQYCNERGQSGRRYICKYNALIKQIEGGY